MTGDELFELSLLPGFKAAQRRTAAEARKIGRMHDLYGRCEGQRCGDCVSFVGRQFNGRYFKCLRFGDTSGPGTDWRKRYPACGKFEARESGLVDAVKGQA